MKTTDEIAERWRNQKFPIPNAILTSFQVEREEVMILLDERDQLKQRIAELEAELDAANTANICSHLMR